MWRQALWTFVILSVQGIAETPSAPVRKQGESRIDLHCGADLDAGQLECSIILDGDGTEPPSHLTGKHIDFTLEPAGDKRFLSTTVL